MNSLSFAGRLAEAPMLTRHARGVVCKFTLIQNMHRGTDEASGEKREEEVVAIQFTCFGAMGEALSQHCLKGDQVLVRASVHNNDYQKEDGGPTTYGFTYRVEEWTFGAPGPQKREQLASQRS